MAKGYAEALALIEAGKQMALAAKPEDKRPQRTDKEKKPPSWEQLWLEEQQRRAKFDDFMKVLKKQLAEEPKKKGILSWGVDQVALLLLAIVPLNWAVMYLLFK
jgi:hypothetical protein